MRERDLDATQRFAGDFDERLADDFGEARVAGTPIERHQSIDRRERNGTKRSPETAMPMTQTRNGGMNVRMLREEKVDEERFVAQETSGCSAMYREGKRAAGLRGARSQP